jgi:hypothetical protein
MDGTSPNDPTQRGSKRMRTATNRFDLESMGNEEQRQLQQVTSKKNLALFIALHPASPPALPHSANPLLFHSNL